MQRVIDAFRDRLAANVIASAERILEARIPFYLALPQAGLRGILTRAFEAAAEDLERGEPRSMVERLALLGAERSQQGIPVVDVLQGLNIGFRAVSDDFATHFADDLEALLFWERARSEIAYAGAVSLASAYLTARERVVGAQAEEIVQLSLRVLPLYPGILALPLVGRISGDRAQQITQVLLAAIARHRCSFALLDLSGVAVFDSEAAAHLMRTAQAAALLGATPIFVGVSPAAAQTIVGLDSSAALGRLTTLADLESGLCHALGRLGVTLTPGPAGR